jgi:hypothetical protein
VSGNVEEAADELVLVSLVAGHAEEEKAIRAGAQALFRSSQTLGTAQKVPLWTAHPWSDHRYIRLLCLLYESNAEQHAEGSAIMAMPEGSAQQCPGDLQRRQQHWDALLAPHLKPKDPPELPSSPPAPVMARGVPPPEQFIRTYYQAINQRQYTQTWAMLSPHFKKTHLCCDLEGKYKFNNYTGWWNTIEKVDVLTAKAHERNILPVLVLSTLRYYKKNGKVIDETHLFSLVEDLANNSWLIEEQMRGTRGQNVR